MNILPVIQGTVDSWDMIVMGHLRVNTYFGESYDAPPRGDPSTCTSVMVRGRQADGSPYVLIIDATTRWTPEDYYFDINRRTGLHASDVTHCFVTHHHGDHFEALPYFPNARWMAAPKVVELIGGGNEKANVTGLEGVTGEFLPGVVAVNLPGHTDSLHGVAFSCGGKNILVAGDAVMSRHHFVHETTDFQNDPAMQKIAGETIRSMKESFDIVVPGHDNLIVV
jgi:glyoxylase-like metal-dependent hydrolase (beta-lactamase superfamily II)